MITLFAEPKACLNRRVIMFQQFSLFISIIVTLSRSDFVPPRNKFKCIKYPERKAVSFPGLGKNEL